MASCDGVLRREPQVDFQVAAEAGLRGLSDNQVLAFAARLSLPQGIRRGAVRPGSRLTALGLAGLPTVRNT